MILSLEELSSRVGYEPDICVVGAGFAGYETARVAAEAGRSVLIVESGVDGFDAGVQSLSEARQVGMPLRRSGSEFTGSLPQSYIGLPAVREFGGTSNAWSGKWKPFDRLDLGPRPWLGLSGWPIDWTELRALYDEVREDYGLGPTADVAGRYAGRIGLAERAPDLAVSAHFEEAEPLRVKQRLRALGSRDGVTICLGATVVDMALGEAAGEAGEPRISALRLRALGGAGLDVAARMVVLAAGGLETPRLMLNCDRQIEGGLGNASGLVGRCYMDHPKIELKRKFGPRLTGRFAGLPAVAEAEHRVGFRLSETAQSRARTLNHAIYVLERRRRLSGDRYTYRIYLEQAPNPDSRVFLGEERDALGLRRLVVDWRLGSDELQGFGRFVDTVSSGLSQIGVPPPPKLPDDLGSDAFSTGNHHMGATRMASSPEEGVVDADCRVFGVDNLYVAGSSVFPTSGNANPTLTIVALARRLGRRLADRARRESRPAAVSGELQPGPKVSSRPTPSSGGAARAR